MDAKFVGIIYLKIADILSSNAPKERGKKNQ